MTIMQERIEILKRLKQLPVVHLPLAVTLLAAVLLAGAITILALWCQPNALRVVLINMKAQPLLIVLNAMPVGLLLLVFTCLFRNVFFSAALVNLCVCGLSIANRIKIEVRDEPLFPRDFGLLKEVGTIVGDYAIPFPWIAIALVVLATLALMIMGVFVRCKPFPVAKLCGWLGRILGATASFAVLTALILTVYASNDLYNSFRVSNAYYIPSVFNELGFPYCFCHQFTTYPVDKPEQFNRTEAESWDTAETTAGQGKDVHVIMVMNEAFSDISDDKAFSYTGETDPLKHLHALQNDPHAISGHIVVPGFAGGTANTEFDVLTGIQTNALSATTTSSFRVVNRNLNSLFRLFGSDGYHTSYFHCGDDWFYNRENVLRWMGAEETVFIDQMPDAEYKGRWVTDDYMAGLIEAEFEDAVSQGKSLFHYSTTIQNHMSYTADKYGSDYPFPALESSAQISDSVKTMLEVYLEGVRDGDAMLGRLTEYFSKQNEPVVLVFFGDHLPYLGDNQLGYSELGMEVAIPENDRINVLCSYETPYVIWANDAAAATLDWKSAVETLDIPENGKISASFLGAAVAELTGRAEQDNWFRYLNELRRITPVVQKKTYMTMDGTYITNRELDDWASESGLTGQDIRAAVLKWRQWSYYNLRYKDME